MDTVSTRDHWNGSNITVVSQSLTIDTTGVTIGSLPTAFSQLHAYRFASSFSGTNFMGLYGIEPSSAIRQLYLQHSTTATGKTLITGLQASTGGIQATVQASCDGTTSTVDLTATRVNFNTTSGVGTNLTFEANKHIQLGTSGEYGWAGDTDTFVDNDSPNRIRFSAGAIKLFWDGGQLFPENDNAKDLGHPSFRWRTVYAGTGTINTSDVREKTNIQPTAYGRDFLLALKPIDFRWANPTIGTGVYQGLLAQDVARVAPAFGGVSYDADGVATGLNYSAFVAPLVAGFQDLEARVRALEARIQALEARR